MIRELRYSNTNTYLIEGSNGRLLFDTGWAGTFPALCGMLGEMKISVQDIDYLMISHFHPDHMGIAQEIARQGPKILIVDLQIPYIHSSDHIFEKDNNTGFLPIQEESLSVVTLAESRAVLASLGIAGEILHTPGHSEDSITLALDSGELFVGDLNPLYELELHRKTAVEASWNRLLNRKPNTIYYGHAKTAKLRETEAEPTDDTGYETDTQDIYLLVQRIMLYIDKKWTLSRISKRTGADMTFVEDVARMYLTHRDIGVQGILDRIEIKNR